MEPEAEKIFQDYKFTNFLIHQFVDGVSDAESVLQPPFKANCMNWIVGHIISRRNSSLLCLGRPVVWPEAVLAQYRTGSEPIRSQDKARPFSQLVNDLDETLKRLEIGLADSSMNDLNLEFENDRGRKKVIDHLKGFHWHETFHLGQLELLRSFIEAEREKGY